MLLSQPEKHINVAVCWRQIERSKSSKLKDFKSNTIFCTKRSERVHHLKVECGDSIELPSASSSASQSTLSTRAEPSALSGHSQVVDILLSQPGKMIAVTRI